MSLLDELDREWERMMRSCGLRRGIVRWTDQTLARFTSPQQIVDFAQERGHPVQTDEVFRPLIRLAKTDDLAARTILQAMMPGLRATVRRYGWADDHSELIAMTIASGFEQIRRYPIDRRPNRIAANILADTKRALHDRFVQLRATETPTADLDVRVIPHTSHPAENLSAVVGEAVRRGVVSTSDGKLIMQTRVFDVTFDELAAHHDINTNSLRRRRQRAEATIREAEMALPL